MVRQQSLKTPRVGDPISNHPYSQIIAFTNWRLPGVFFSERDKFPSIWQSEVRGIFVWSSAFQIFMRSMTAAIIYHDWHLVVLFALTTRVITSLLPGVSCHFCCLIVVGFLVSLLKQNVSWYPPFCVRRAWMLWEWMILIVVVMIKIKELQVCFMFFQGFVVALWFLSLCTLHIFRREPEQPTIYMASTHSTSWTIHNRSYSAFIMRWALLVRMLVNLHDVHNWLCLFLSSKHVPVLVDCLLLWYLQPHSSFIPCRLLAQKIGFGRYGVRPKFCHNI